MAIVVPAGPTIRSQLYAALVAAVPLHTTGLLAAGPGSVLPRQGYDVAKAPRPFLYVRLEGDGSQGEQDLLLATWVIEVHDQPASGLFAIETIVAHLKWMFDGARWEAADSADAAPAARAYRSFWAGRVGERPDAGFQTTKMLARIQLAVS